jgi:hypothetical protein
MVYGLIIILDELSQKKKILDKSNVKIWHNDLASRVQ